MFLDVISFQFWSEHIALSPEAIQEVLFWKESFKDCHGHPIWKINPRIDVISYSDASDSEWGSYYVNATGTNMAGCWSEAQRV